MRIIAGKYKNKKIVSKFKGISPNIKPTTSKVREAVFNIIFNYFKQNGQKIQHCSFLDLYCGTGAVGIEAISRGFNPVYFVDQDKDCILLIKHNLANIVNNESYQVIRSDIMKLQISSSIYFDVIYLDPPYDQNITSYVLNYINQFTHSKSLVVLEASKNFSTIQANNYRIIGSKSYSNCTVLILVRA